VINVGHPYPAFMRRWPTYNSPFVEMVHQTAVAADRPIALVDVGASIGDTVRLEQARCPGEVADVWCVEGDDAFMTILRANFDDDPHVHLVHALASDGATAIPELVRVHAGTASPAGATLQPAAPLDALLADAAHVDAVKIDTDGFDGDVLAGAGGILARDHPTVLFEWHPRLARAAATDIERAFRELAGAGYSRFLWYDKFGRYATTESGDDADTRAARAEWCLTGATPAPDWHYDVIAISDVRPLDEAALRSLAYASTRRE
jgi:FkbM family methyltransferase